MKNARARLAWQMKNASARPAFFTHGIVSRPSDVRSLVPASKLSEQSQGLMGLKACTCVSLQNYAARVKTHMGRITPQKPGTCVSQCKARVSRREACVSRPKHDAPIKHLKARVSNTKAPACIKSKGFVMFWRPKLVQASTQQPQGSSSMHVKPGPWALNLQRLKDNLLAFLTTDLRSVPHNAIVNSQSLPCYVMNCSKYGAYVIADVIWAWCTL